MTTETIHPRITKAADDLAKRLIALDPDVAEVVLSARIVVRNGVPRKTKWTLEEEEACTP